jgi:hypothetical protein
MTYCFTNAIIWADNYSMRLEIRLKCQKNIEITYDLIENTVVNSWCKKIKHLQNIPPLPDKISNGRNLEKDLPKIHREFCELTGTKHQEMDYENRENLNLLHLEFEKKCTQYVNQDPEFVLFRYNKAIHAMEARLDQRQDRWYRVGWGVKEGPLTHHEPLWDHYSDKIRKGSIYMIWAELGKNPNNLYEDADAHTRPVPHHTFRAQFAIALEDNISDFDDGFKNFWSNKKDQFEKEYGFEWSPKHYNGGILLGHTKTDFDFDDINRFGCEVDSLRLI